MHDWDFESVEEFDGCVTGNVVSVGDDTGVESFGCVAFCLAEEFTAHEDCGGGSVSGDVVLLVE